MKKILAIAVSLIMVMALSVSVYATQLDLDNTYAGSDVTTGTSEELIGIMFPDGLTYNTGDKVTVHFVGHSDGDFRVWFSHAEGFVTMSPNPNWKASENGFTTGDFDFTIELDVEDKDGRGETIADSIIFKAGSYGETLNNFSLSLVEIVDGNDAVVEEPETNDAPAEPETVPETNDAPAPAAETPAANAPAKTGVTLAVVPAIIALTAAIVTKRK